MSHKTAKRNRLNTDRLRSIIDRRFPGDDAAPLKEAMFRALSKNLAAMKAKDQIEALDKLEEISEKGIDLGGESTTIASA